MAFASLNGYPCLNPNVFAKNFMRRASSIDGQFLDLMGRGQLVSRCNRFINTIGPKPSYGCFAVTRSVLDKIKDSTDIELLLESGTKQIKYQKLIFASKATSVSPIAPSTQESGDAFVIEIADRRFYGNHPTMKLDFVGDKMFNVPAPSYGQDQFYEDTINQDTGDPWSWQEMFEELWPVWLSSTVPELATAPDVNPVGFDFRSFTNYQAIQIILGIVGNGLMLNYDGTYTIIDHGVKDSTYYKNTAKRNENKKNLDESVEWIEPAQSKYPKGVTVFFQKTATNSGSENVLTKENGQWYTDMLYSVSVLATTSELSGVEISKALNGYHQIWDDMPCWVDPYSGVIANQADLDARAQQRMTAYYADLIKNDYRLHEVYSDLIDFYLCGTLQAISYVQQLGRGGAWTTEIFCHSELMAEVQGGNLVPTTVQPQAPWQYRSAPVYPSDLVLVRNDGIYSSGSSTDTLDDKYNLTEIGYNPANDQFVDRIYLKGIQPPG